MTKKRKQEVKEREKTGGRLSEGGVTKLPGLHCLDGAREREYKEDATDFLLSPENKRGSSTFPVSCQLQCGGAH
jgi:hypothetical protein